jgi:putative chitinase
MRTIRELLAFYEDTIFWAGDWHDPIDEMHWQMGYDTFNNPHTGDVIARKIRPDGYSLFRRGTTSPSPVNTGVDVLARATGLNAARANEILPMVVNGLRRAECDNVNRIAMWLAQIGHESGSFRYTEEIQSGDESTDRWLYKGRTWIQITWRSNYAAFSKWCQRLNLVPTETYFVDHPKELAELKWAGLGAAWYWTVARADINRLSDSGDIVTVTQRINGGQNGIDDRRARYSRALGVGTDLLGLISTGDDFLSALSDDEQRQLFDRVNQTWGATFNKVESKSIYRDPGGEHTESNMWSTKDLIRNMDGFAHQHYVEDSALLGDFDSIRRVTMVAAGQGTANDQGSINRARAVLARIEAANPKALQAFIDAQKAQ